MNHENLVPKREEIERFNTIDEFCKRFYPKATEGAREESNEGKKDLGTQLALESLNQHACGLKF
jgi:hypothetical protein